MSQESVQFERRDAVALVRFDDGKANALSHAAIDALGRALDRAEKEARAVAVVGRPERFCAGFDLNVMRAGGGAAVRLVAAGARLALRIFESPLPVVLGCSGHALAMGGVLLLAADRRVGVRGDFKIGLNEVAIGMTLPVFATELARERVAPPYLARATSEAEIFDPEGACAAGFLDRVVGPAALLDAVLADAERLAALPADAHAHTKRRIRGAVAARIRASLDEDASGATPPRA